MKIPIYWNKETSFMFPLCYICFTKIVQFEKRNSGNVQLIFIFTYKYSERWVQRQAKFTFPAWLYRTVPMSYKYTNKRERSKTKLALILFSRAKVSSSFNSNIVKGECNGKRNLHFRLDSAEPYPIFYKDSESQKIFVLKRFYGKAHAIYLATSVVRPYEVGHDGRS